MYKCHFLSIAFLLCCLCHIGAGAEPLGVDSLKSMGTSAYYKGRVDIAESCFDKILEYYQESGNIEKQADALIWIAEIRRSAMQFELAEISLDEATKKIQRNNLEATELGERLWNRKAAILYEQEKLNDALIASKKSIAIGHKTKEKYLANNYNILGACYQQLGKHDSAYHFLVKSLDWSKSQKDTDNVVSSCINLNSHFLTFHKNCDSAIFYAKKAMRLAKEAKIESRYYVLYDVLSRSFECQGSYKEALEAKKKESILKDRLRDQMVLKRIQSLSAMKSLEYEKKENSLLKEKIESRNTILILGSLLVFFILVTLVVEYIRRKRTTLLYTQLEKQKEELTRTNELKNTMFSVVAHDLRNPLNTLAGVLNMVKSGDLSLDESKYLLDKLGSQLFLTQMLLDNLLKWSRAQIDGIKIFKERTDVSKLMEMEVSIVGEMAHQKEISIEQSFESDLMLKIDPQVLRFIVRNLLTNAIKFSEPNSSIWINSQKTERGLKVEVSDEGIGIKKEQLDTVFTSTVESSYGTKKEKGSGLGLAICFNFVKEHGGDIKVESEEGKGSKFILELYPD